MNARQFWLFVGAVMVLTIGLTIGAVRLKQWGPHSASVTLGEPQQAMHFGLDQPFPRIVFTDLSGGLHDLQGARGKVIVLLVQGNHCPCSKAYIGRMNAIQKDYASKGVQVWAFNPNVDEPEEQTRIYVSQNKVQYPVAVDRDDTVADLLGAACMTEVWVADRNGILRYHGRIDDNIYHPEQVKSRDLRDALDAILAGKPAPHPETRAYACSITRETGT